MNRERGIALLVVLWACTLLAILVGGLASLAHLESEQGRYAMAAQKARYAAEAGVMKAIHDVYEQRREAREPLEGVRWIGDGQPFEFALDGARVTVVVEDEIGKVDLNRADPTILAALFAQAGDDPAKAVDLAAEVVAWRSETGVPDAESMARYRAAGRAYVPRQAPFPSIDELQSVLGMDDRLFARVQPVLTIWSGRTKPAPFYASPLVRATLAGQAQGDAVAEWVPGSPTITIVSKGVAEGMSVTLRATVRLSQLTGTPNPRLPLYTVLRWQDVPRG
ncbi:general secretion pathway protein GspK [Luteibacter pinisoli]|uniref:General secretion pathway protein GspK n=1 Tax=Luteibacter pinisoli TaxID=2589080 RepID=A0A4Y5Z6T8_9GAMM|nr:type II secretion system protein GspK [Luteibacter pinisoli]QDE40003.1 general secretion pathway protein GspK [Luteibacter pinisoli]